MRRLFAFAVILILILTTWEQSAAQAPQRYYLHMPTAEDYLTALPNLVTQAEFEDTSKDKIDSWAFQKITANELHFNYADLHTVKFDTLYNATSAVSLNPYDRGLYSDYAWHHLVIDAWLRENKIDLSTKSQWQFRGYTLNITPVDFNGDGQPELIVEITFQPSTYLVYQELLVMQRDNTAPGKYRVVKLPWAFWYSASCGIHEGCGGGAETFKLADVTGDGVPEWLVASHSCGYGECGGGLTVLGWRHGEMVDLVKAEWPNELFWTGVAGGGGGAALPPDGTWTFPISTSGKHQIVQRYQFQDNRDREVTYTTVFTWDKHQDRFIPNDLTVAYADTAPCALRRGQVAMQNSDYSAAISAYQRAVDLLPTSGEPYTNEALQYAQIRLVLAYALSGQVNQAVTLRDKVQVQVATSATMGYLLNALKVYNDDKDKVQLCAALHRAVAHYNPYGDRDNTSFWVFGQTDDVQGRGMYLGGDFSADNAGCDISNLLKPLMDQLSVIPNVSPTALNAEGVKIVQSFSADLNGDGKADWLFWMDNIPDQALLLLSAGNHYRFSMPFIDIPGEKVQMATLKLPGSAGSTLVSFGFGNLEVWDADNSWPCGQDHPFGSVDLAQVVKDKLQPIGSYLLCEPRTLAQIFPSPYHLHAWQAVDYSTPAVETIFSWSAKDGTFSPPTPADSSELREGKCVPINPLNTAVSIQPLHKR